MHQKKDRQNDDKLLLIKSLINPYSPSVTFRYPQKTSENLRFSDVFRGYRNVTLGEYGLIQKSYAI